MMFSRDQHRRETLELMGFITWQLAEPTVLQLNVHRRHYLLPLMPTALIPGEL